MTSDLENLGEVIAEQVQKIHFGMGEAWERVLRLHIKPRPAYIPEKLWHKLVQMVVVQSQQWK